MKEQTIRTRIEDQVLYLQLHRPEANNAINDRLVEECLHALAAYEAEASVVILEGLPDVFCTGADFQGIHEAMAGRSGFESSPEPLYELYQRLAYGPFVTVAHVRGTVNAGGVGFAAACDIVLADPGAKFSLSELLFGLFPACVLPFLIRRTGRQRAHYLTLMTRPFSAQEACDWGLADACEAPSDSLLRKHLLRLKRLGKPGITRYKQFMAELDGSVEQARPIALAANREMFSDQRNLEGILRYVEQGIFPWER
ncbi:enoyl-CoA hydratase/isomerase [Paenibacillus piscarius]|uniref:enoyl-CoA hydratase/isomerase n=1 Tax=Paenibacillus piscarius TaxID=1089681 RepID=UPI001EE8CD91|nr:enoyl-CoA hydratase/isomerase [Paenibacillus piscarius]